MSNESVYKKCLLTLKLYGYIGKGEQKFEKSYLSKWKTKVFNR